MIRRKGAEVTQVELSLEADQRGCSSSYEDSRRDWVSCAVAPESELAHRRGLVIAYSTSNNLCLVIILSTNWAPGQSAQDCDLPRVR